MLNNLFKKSVIIWVLVGLAIAIICGVTFYLLQANKLNDSGWKTYKNDKYGFEFQYPSSKGNLYDYVATTGEIVIGIIATDRPDSVDGWAGLSTPKLYQDLEIQNNYVGSFNNLDNIMKLYNDDGYKKSVVMVGNIQGFGISSFQVGDEVFFSLPSGQPMSVSGNFNDPLFIQMLSTFKFIQ